MAILLGAFFTAGCITIHEFWAHARAMTSALALVAVCLGLFVALIAMAESPPDAAADGPRKTRGRSSVSTIANPPAESEAEAMAASPHSSSARQ